MLILVLSLFAQSAAIADSLDYRLVTITNSSFVAVTAKDLANKLSEQRSLLPAYACDGKKEFSLFTDFAFSNSKGDSLRVKSGDGTLYIYQSGTYTDSSGQESSYFEDPFMNYAQTALSKLERLPSGKQLLRKLEQAPYPLILTYGNPHFAPQEVGQARGQSIYMAGAITNFQSLVLSTEIPFHQIGSGGDINWDPVTNFSRIESDNRVRSIPNYITLGHEMYHAYDGVRGLLDLRSVDGPTYENEQVAEYRAVYFENQIRQESGMRFAKYYGESDPRKAAGTPSMLTDAGERRMIPSACLSAQDLIDIALNK